MPKTILHNKPAPKFQPEFRIAAVTGYASFEDGQSVALRTMTGDGDALVLIFATSQIESAIGALRQAKQAAIQKMSTEPGSDKKSIFVPQSYATVITAQFAGVLLVFDRETPTELMIGLDVNSARDLGQGLKTQSRQVQGRPHLILPETEIQR